MGTDFLPPEANNPDFWAFKQAADEKERERQRLMNAPPGAHAAQPQSVVQPQADPMSVAMSAPVGAYAAKPERTDPTAAVYTAPPRERARPASPRMATTRRTNTQRSTTGTIGGEDDLLSVEQASQEREKAALHNTVARQQSAEDQAETAAMRAETAQRTQAKIAGRSQEVESKTDDVMAEVDALNDKIMESGDLNSFWANKSTGSRILAAIALGLGGFGAAMTGGENGALKIIQGAMDRDLTAQKQKRADIKDTIKGKLSFVQIAAGVTDDEISRDLIANKLATDYVIAQTDKLAAARGTEEALALAATQKAELLERKAELNNKLRERQTVVQQTRTSTGPVGGAAAGAGEEDGDVIPGYRVDPEIWKQLNSTQKGEARRGAAGLEAALANVRRMESLRATHGVELFSTEAAAEFVQARSAAIAGMTQAYQTGTLQKEEYDRYSESMGGDLSASVSDLALVFGHDAKANKLGGLRKTLETNALPRLAVYGLTRGSGTGAAAGNASYVTPGVR